MSVINDTLRELELRGGRGALPQPARAVAPRPERRSFNPVWLLPPLLGLALWGWWPTLSGLWTAPRAEGPSTHRASVQQAAEPTPVVEAQTEAPVEPQLEPSAVANTVPAAAKPGSAPEIAQAEEAVVEAAPTQTLDVAETAPPVPADTEQKLEPKTEPTPAPERATEPEPKPAPQPAAKPQPELAIQSSPLSARERAEQLWQQATTSNAPEALLREALALAPDLHAARLALLEHLGPLAEAELVAAVRDYPREAGYPVLGAEWALAKGETLLAERWLDAASLLGASTPWLARRATLAQQLDQLVQAEQDYRRLLQRQPQRGAWWFGLGYSLDRQGQYKDARSAYQSALASGNLSQEALAFIEQRLGALGNG